MSTTSQSIKPNLLSGHLSAAAEKRLALHFGQKVASLAKKVTDIEARLASGIYEKFGAPMLQIGFGALILGVVCATIVSHDGMTNIDLANDIVSTGAIVWGANLVGAGLLGVFSYYDELAVQKAADLPRSSPVRKALKARRLELVEAGRLEMVNSGHPETVAAGHKQPKL